MAKFRQFIGKPAVIALLFLLAIGLLLGSAVGGARAALNAQSQYYVSQVETARAGVTLLENGNPVANGGTLMAEVVGGTDPILPGVNYPVALAIKNTGSIDEYVRVTVYRYWTDASGVKQSDTKWDPDMIKLNVPAGSGWTEDTAAQTAERSVYYYQSPLSPGDTSDLFLESVRIENDVVYRAEQTTVTNNGLTTITTSYLYDGACCHVRIVADAVQGHSAKDAVKSAWGVDPALVGLS